MSERERVSATGGAGGAPKTTFAPLEDVCPQKNFKKTIERPMEQ